MIVLETNERDEVDVDRIDGTIKQIRAVDARTPVLAERGKLEFALLAAPGSYQGACVNGLSMSLTLFLADLGVVGRAGGLTAHGANVRARLDREWFDAKMPL